MWEKYDKNGNYSPDFTKRADCGCDDEMDEN